jgi:cytochrome c-type biogenesis protein CcmH
LTAPRARRREPLAVLLVAVNLFLAGLLIHRKLHPAPKGGLPPGHPDVSVPAGLASPDALALTGVVKLSPALKEPWPKGAHVFVVARAEGGGPPYAVRRYDDVKPPFAFALGPANLMIQGLPAPARLILSARVDQDGDAMTRQLGDLESGPSAPVPPRGSVELAVDRPVELAPAAGR